jgi:hypothetical protein
MLLLLSLLFRLRCLRQFSGKVNPKLANADEGGDDDELLEEFEPVSKIAKGEHGVFKSKGKVISPSQQEVEVQCLNPLGAFTSGA